jgi:hypothetical protein
LLKKAYKKRLDIIAFLQACSFFKDKRNANTFITLKDKEFHDRFLEINLGVELYQASI